MRFLALLAALLLGGCWTTTMELRTQHCARHCIKTYGYKCSDGEGVWSVEVHRDQCSCVMWDRRVVPAGRVKPY